MADFLFIQVVKNPDMGEITARGIQFEIEAKIGTLISKDTKERLDIAPATEAVLKPDARVGFESNMSEVSDSFSPLFSFLGPSY